MNEPGSVLVVADPCSTRSQRSMVVSWSISLVEALPCTPSARVWSGFGSEARLNGIFQTNLYTSCSCHSLPLVASVARMCDPYELLQQNQSQVTGHCSYWCYDL